MSNSATETWRFVRLATVAGSLLALVRYNSDLSPDSTFGTEGKVTTDVGASDTAFAVAIHPDGKILAAGTSRSSGPSVFSRFAIARMELATGSVCHA